MLNFAEFQPSSHLGDNVKRKIRGILRRDTQSAICCWCLSRRQTKENWALPWLTKTCRLDNVSSLRENHFEDPSQRSENSNVRAPLTKLTLTSFGAPLSLMKSTYWVTGRLHPKHLLQSSVQVRIDLLQVQIGPDAASNLSAVNLTEQTMTAASHIHMEKRERDSSGVLQETKACSSASDKSISLGLPDFSLSKIRTIPWLQSNREGFTTSHIIPPSSHSDAVVQVWTAVLSFPRKLYNQSSNNIIKTNSSLWVCAFSCSIETCAYGLWYGRWGLMILDSIALWFT